MTTAAAKPTSFAIVHDSVLIVPPNERDPLQGRPIYGSVAYLPRLRRHVARAGIPFQWNYWSWNEHLGRAGELLATHTDWWQKLRDQQERIGPVHQFDAQIDRALFQPGRVRYPKRPPVINWHEYLRRHCSGDFGATGEYDPAPLSVEEVWSLNLLSAARQNDASIEIIAGPVRSEFELTDDDQRLWHRHVQPGLDERTRMSKWGVEAKPPEPPHVHVISLIGQRTLMWLA
jgi:hypothetical protein